MTRLVLRDSAVDDINAIADHIAQDNPEAARNWYDAVLDAANQLAQMPGMGAVREFRSARAGGSSILAYQGVPELLDVLPTHKGWRGRDPCHSRSARP
jgi:plasmid stabilization system protein ParE